MKRKVFLRPALSIIFGFIGIFIARGGTPPDIFAIVGEYFLFVAFLSFATLGFILPDIIVLAGNAGITVLAKQIAEIIVESRPRTINVPRVSFRRSKNGPKYTNPIVVDTSVLVDGRIIPLINLGFLYGTILVIPSVVEELHKLSDSADENKRIRGRRGLDFLGQLKKTRNTKIEVLRSEPKAKEVDYKIVELAKKTHGKLMTLDFNLNKVAKIRGVDVLNINDLTNSLKLQVQPKDVLTIKISGLGKEKGQGVGYLDDGTMIVVDSAGNLVGKKASVEVERVFQSSAGKMIFAKLPKTS